MATKHLMTADDLLHLEDDGDRYELIEGELIRMSPTGDEHSEIGMGFGARLWQHVVPRGLGKVYGADMGFVLEDPPTTVLSPDVSFVQASRLPSSGRQRNYLRLAPDLVVEIVSPSDSLSDLEKKVARYLAGGVRLVLVVNPRNSTIAMHRLGRRVVILRDLDELNLVEVVPGFRVRVADLFA